MIITMQHRKIILVGQPNCGKSTLFNEVAGYKSFSSNFPGSTVEYTLSHVNICGQTFDVVDLPGIYSLTSLDNAAKEAQRYLLNQPSDVIINVIDASILSRSLELTIQLMDLEKPMILCLNMMDEADRKGIRTDIQKLSEILGIPVFPTIAARGKGVQVLFEAALRLMVRPKKPRHVRNSRDVEHVIAYLSRLIKKQVTQPLRFSSRLLAIKILENDVFFERYLTAQCSNIQDALLACKKKLAVSHGKSSDEVINGERHMLAMSIFEKTGLVTKPRIVFKDQVDRILMHPVWGYVCLIVILLLFFELIFKGGSLLETPLLNIFEGWTQHVLNVMTKGSLIAILVKSILDGLSGGMGIILPYLLPFLVGLSVLEDVGYLPRVAFLMDTFMHRIGLHGTAVIPAILGYGCNVPAVMATRILESPRDRYIAAFISTLVPCAARMTIIFGLVGVYLGGAFALGIYLLNIIVIALTGAILSRLLPEDTPGMLLEIPVYHRPHMKVVLLKTWFRIREFIIVAWPLLIAGSVILTLADHFNWIDLINHSLRFITWLLDLPEAVGTTLIFGILRKELSMLMLFQALGTRNIESVMTIGQIFVFTIFVVFYVPCVGTIGVLGKQVKFRKTIVIIFSTLLLALTLSLISRGVIALFA
jgi:ferrous iron transport protein B